MPRRPRQVATSRSEIEREMIKDSGVSRRKLAPIEFFLEYCLMALAEGKSVFVSGFGTFEVRRKKGGRRFRHPKTGQLMQVGDRVTVVFVPHAKLRRACGDRPTPPVPVPVEPDPA